MLRFGIWGSSPDLQDGFEDLVSVALEMGARSTFADGSEERNLTCPCGFFGSVNYTCADGVRIVQFCDGTEGVYRIRCPGESSECFSRGKRGWSADDGCEATVVSTLPPIVTCACLVDYAAARDYSAKTDVLASAVAYTGTVATTPELKRADPGSFGFPLTRRVCPPLTNSA